MDKVFLYVFVVAATMVQVAQASTAVQLGMQETRKFLLIIWN